MVESIGKAYRPWLVLSMVVLVGSLGLLMVAVGGWFLSFGEPTPLWENVLAIVAGLGFLAGVGGFVALFAVAAVRSRREQRQPVPAGAAAALPPAPDEG